MCLCVYDSGLSLERSGVLSCGSRLLCTHVPLPFNSLQGCGVRGGQCSVPAGGERRGRVSVSGPHRQHGTEECTILPNSLQ